MTTLAPPEETIRREEAAPALDVPAPASPVPGGPPRPPRGPKPIARPAARPTAPIVRNSAWWVGVSWLTLSAFVVGFILHLTLISGLQHDRAQSLAYGELRETLAMAETPVAQLGIDEMLVPVGTPVALLEIPRLGLREVIVEGTTAEALREGPGHRRDTVLPGQAGTSVVMGRQSTYGGPFGDLGQLVPGDEIVVTTGQGANTFEVFGMRRDGDPLPAPLTDGGRLELVTANGLALFPAGALYLDAALVTDVQETPGRVFTSKALPQGEVAMGADFGDWSYAVLMLLLLTAAGAATLWAWRHWGRWQTWIAGGPLIVICAMSTADAAANLLPNLL
ncbi:sortase [Okibacterium endophyticum]